MFRESSDQEQELYQAVARAGTLLLQIGDAASQDENGTSASDLASASKQLDFSGNVESKSVTLAFDEKQGSSDVKLLELAARESDAAARGDDISARQDDQHILKQAMDAGPELAPKAEESISSASPRSESPEDLELRVAVRGMSLTEALADAQRSLTSSPGRTESIKSDDFVYVDSSNEAMTPGKNLKKTESETVYGSSYKDIASCIGDSPEILYEDFESGILASVSSEGGETIMATPISIEKRATRVEPLPSHASGDVGAINENWCIGYRQFIACVLSEPLLVEFFEQTYDLRDALQKAASEGMHGSSRSPDDSFNELSI